MVRNIIDNRIKALNNNKGSTLVEMIVCFVLLSVFVSTAVVIIGMITSLYYQIKGETYAKQVSDIIIEKIASELDGAIYVEGDTVNNPQIDDDVKTKKGSKIALIDKTNTSVVLSVRESRLCIDYMAIVDDDDPTKNREATTWKYDDSVYNGFTITEFEMIRGDGLVSEKDKIRGYGIDGSLSDYDNNVILILISLYSPKYGEYKSYRFVQMYNVPKDYGL
ncbi:MAG: prepilin-type N-terminal cleavage/methylation domain-containing protein [Eubacterium sp.]|nr:prepilin-type N-terminal cleavage/methylation domain-containing protein [Eubacterium sp.]